MAPACALRCIIALVAAAAAPLLAIGGSVERLAGSGGQAAISQGRPWKTFVPPHSDCNGGYCNDKQSAALARGKLRQMGDAQLKKMKFELQNEVKKMELDLAKSKRENNGSLKRFRERVQRLSTQSATSQEAFDKAQSEKQAKVDELKTDTDDLFDGALSIAAEKDHGSLQDLHGSIVDTLMAAHRCKPKCPELLLAISAVKKALTNSSLSIDEEQSEGGVGVQGDAPAGMVKHELLVREVEALNDKRTKLAQEQTQAQFQYTVAQRKLVDQQDDFKREQFATDVANEKAKHVLDTKESYLRGQKRAATNYKEHQSSSAARQQKSMGALGKQLKDLVADLKKCAC